MNLPAGGEPTGRRPMLPFRAEPSQVVWAETQPPDTPLQVPILSLAPIVGPSNVNLGNIDIVTVLVVVMVSR